MMPVPGYTAFSIASRIPYFSISGIRHKIPIVFCVLKDSNSKDRGALFNASIFLTTSFFTSSLLYWLLPGNLKNPSFFRTK